MRSAAASVLLVLLLAGCANSLSPLQLTEARLAGTDARVHALVAADTARFTVLEFFSAGCDGQAAHDARLRELYARYHARGVAFYAVDSEVDAALARDTLEASHRRYPFPILIDPQARLAAALAAEYATYCVILDAHAQVLYRGSIDSDDVVLQPDATFYVRDALDDLLAGRSPRRPEGKTLGCALRVW